MRNLQKIIVAILFIGIVLSCNKEDNPQVKPEPTVNGYYILNSGKWGSNNSNLSYYNKDTKQLTENVFEAVNGKKLGDTGNDMIIYGSKMYIAVTESSVVFVTDLNGKIIKEVVMENTPKNMAPRYLCSGNGKVYVTYRDGYLAEIDTTNFAAKKVKVGISPEGVMFLSGKIYVANSDGMNNGVNGSVSVVNPANLSVVKTIEKVTNPQTFHVFPDGSLYLITWKNYATNDPAALYKVNTQTDELTLMKDVADPTRMAVGKDGKGFLISSTYDKDYNQTIKYYFFNSKTNKLEGEFTTTNEVPRGEYICGSNDGSEIFIGSTDYVNNGDVYILNSNGEVVSKIESGGINPIKVCEVRY